MRFRLISAATALLIAGPSFAQGWIEYADETQLFSVNFPAQPEISDIDYRSEYGAIYPARVYSVEKGASAYSVTVVDFTEAKSAHVEPNDKTDDANARSLWLYDQFASIAQAARGFRERDGEVTYDAWNNIDRVEGHMLQLTNADQSRTFAGMYLHASHLYILEATVPAGSPPPGLFQQSLSFLDEEGKTIRYELEPDRSRRRVR